MLVSTLLFFAMSDLTSTQMVASPPLGGGNPHYIGTRSPQASIPLLKLPIGAIEAEGWLRKQLTLQAKGFEGELAQISRFLDPMDNAWLAKDGKGQHGWEEVPYWLRGYGDLGYVLKDKAITQKAELWTDAFLASQRPNGYMGPESNLKDGKPDIWPNMLMMYALMSRYGATGDQRIPAAMTRYAHWIGTIKDENLLTDYWEHIRGADMLYPLNWLYAQTGDASILPVIEKIHRRTAPWEKGIANVHGVNFAQGFREPGEYYAYSKNRKDLEQSRRNLDEFRATYGQVPGGLYGADENARKGFTDARQATETCTMVEMMWSDERLLAISGDPFWADHCEEVVYNMLPAALAPDHRSLRYLTAPNMALSDSVTKSPGLENGGPMLRLDPRDHRCCQHNVIFGWPYFVQHLWMASNDGGAVACFFAPSTAKVKIGKSETVTLKTTTNYPFDETISVHVDPSKSTSFPLYFRIPSWCAKPIVELNGTALPVPAGKGYVRIERTWKKGDKVGLRLPMQPVVRDWKLQKGAFSIYLGPVAFSLKIGEEWRKIRSDDPWAAWEIHPTTDWNFGLLKSNLQLKIKRSAFPKDENPFTLESVPLSMTAQGRQIPEWRLDSFNLVDKLQQSPAQTSSPVQTLELIPMGAARLRISVFPEVTADGTGSQWVKARQRGNIIDTTASFVCWFDSKDACSDGLTPENSADENLPRLTFWDHKGTKEWVEYDFKKPRKLTSSGIYWFDDSGKGGCRVPASWRLLYQVGGEWKPVPTSDAYGTAKDQTNLVKFGMIETTKLRVEIELQKDWSGGILEWSVN